MLGARYPHVITCNETQEKKLRELRDRFKLTWTEIFMKGVEYYEQINRETKGV